MSAWEAVVVLQLFLISRRLRIIITLLEKGRR